MDTSIIEEMPELKDKKVGSKCRIEITVEETKDGPSIIDAQYIGDAGKKSKDEYMKMDQNGKDEYDQSQMEQNDIPVDEME